MAISRSDWKCIGEYLEGNNSGIYRLWTPGGWLVAVSADLISGDVEGWSPVHSMTFVPDPEHKWNP